MRYVSDIGSSSSPSLRTSSDGDDPSVWCLRTCRSRFWCLKRMLHAFMAARRCCWVLSNDTFTIPANMKINVSQLHTLFIQNLQMSFIYYAQKPTYLTIFWHRGKVSLQVKSLQWSSRNCFLFFASKFQMNEWMKCILVARHLPGTLPGCRLSPWWYANRDKRVAHVSSMCSDISVLSRTNWAVCDGTTVDNESFLMVPVSCSWTTNFPCWLIWHTVPGVGEMFILYELKDNFYCILYVFVRSLISCSVSDAYQLNSS